MIHTHHYELDGRSYTEEVDLTAEAWIPGDVAKNYVTILPGGRICDNSHCMHWRVTRNPHGKWWGMQAKTADEAIRKVMSVHPYGFDHIFEVIRINLVAL